MKLMTKKEIKFVGIIWLIFFMIGLIGFFYSIISGWTNGLLYFGFLLVCYIQILQIFFYIILTSHNAPKEKQDE